jgi:hypothetical protein
MKISGRKLVLTLAIFQGIVINTGVANAYDVFVGTQSGNYNSDGAIYKYEGGTAWSNLSLGVDIGQAVMDLEIFNNALYAASQTQSGYGGGNGVGQVWRYDGMNWELTGTMGTSVMDLVTYRDNLYAIVTDNNSSPIGKLYRYDGSNWIYVDGLDYTGFFSATVSDVSGNDEIIIGELNTDAWSTYSPETGLVMRDDPGGSCVWDFAEYDGKVYSGHYWGPIYGTADGRNWEWVTYNYDRNSWALEVFQGNLYVGSGGLYDEWCDEGCWYQNSARLDLLDTSNGSLNTVWEYPLDWHNEEWDDWEIYGVEGITRLSAAPDNSLLYIGTGAREGYFTGDGKAEVWTYNGTSLAKISLDDYFAGGVQSLIVGNLNAPPNCELATTNAAILWPPNHQWANVEILNVTDPEGGAVTINIASITSDEPTASDPGSGGAQHAPDAQGINTPTAQLRVERSGQGNGRVYGINFSAADPQGATCSGYVTVCVPPNQGKSSSCVDSGQNYDATGLN